MKFQSRALSALTMLIWVLVTIRSVFPVNGEATMLPEDAFSSMFNALVHNDYSIVTTAANTLTRLQY